MKSIAIFLTAILLMGCENTRVEYVPVVSPPQPIQCGAEPRPPTLSLLEVDPFGCVTCVDGSPPEECADGDTITAVCIAAKHYENLAINNQALLARMEQGQEQVAFYRDCVKAYNDRLESMPVAKEGPRKEE